MADEPALLYLEPDDEITAVVRRIREADAAAVVLVAPGRSKATSSTVAMRLLAAVAADEGREVSIVGDALTRSLAAEAGLTSYVSVDDARRATPAPHDGPRRAAIHVVRGEEPPASVPVAAALPSSPSDETRAVPIQRPAPARPSTRSERRPERRGRRGADAALVVVLVGGLVLAGGGVAAVLPSARVSIAPVTEPLGPVSHELRFESPQTASGVAEASVTHRVVGTYNDLEPATGSVVFFNWNTFTGVEVPAGTQVASQVAAFGTVETVVVPAGQFTSFNPPTIRAGEAQVGVAAVEPGPAGNVAAGEIDTVLDEETAAQLRFRPDNPERLVTNPDPTSGGLEASGPLVEQADVDAAVAEIRTQLADEVANALAASDGAVLADAAPDLEPTIDVPDDLVGTRDTEQFELGGSLAYDRAWVSVEDGEAAARERLAATANVPAGRELVAGSEAVTIDTARRDGGALVASVSVTAETVATIDEDALAGRIAGLSFADARAELADLGGGQLEISGWPGWVDAVPRLTWRIEFDISAPDPSAIPRPS